VKIMKKNTLILRTKNELLVSRNGQKLVLPLDKYINMTDEEIILSLEDGGENKNAKTKQLATKT